jgi:hypothetical protein
MITTKGAAAREINAQVGAQQADAHPADGEVDDEANDAAANEAARAAPAASAERSERPAGLGNQRAPQRPLWEIAALVIAALVAYQLGRGSEGPRPIADETVARDDEPAPVRPGQFPPSD